MSLLTRFLRGGRSRAYAKGVALLEEGRFAEASELLRAVALDGDDQPATSLAGFHFRQSLLHEGRRHLRAEQWAKAAPWFAEAVSLWSQYPDLHCLHGAALGLAGRWDEALPEAKSALRLNPDYIEARLLEAASLVRLDRSRDAADSLNALVESGRRVEHWLVAEYRGDAPYAGDRLPGNLAESLMRAVAGRSEKEELAAAVALCRAGRWQEGLDRFAALVERQPRYPDYRTRLAAALFQVGRNDEALAEVEAGLALNEDYRPAQDLRGLVLADQGRLREARDFLASADGRRADDGGARDSGSHERLFGAYVRAVLALLHGDGAAAAQLLDGWGELARQFARAELLLAAVDDLSGRPESCGRRLASLAGEWPGETLYAYLLACHHLGGRRWREAENALARWPRDGRQPDPRPLYLQGLLDLAQGRRPVGHDLGLGGTLPAAADPSPPDTAAGGEETAAATGDGGGDAGSGDPVISAPAWRLLEGRAALLRGDAEACWNACAEAAPEGTVTEPLLELMTAAGLAGAVPPGDWRPPAAEPTSCLPGLVHLQVRQGCGAQAEELAARWRGLHPELPEAWWLSVRFWLAPVRGWLA